MAREGHTENRVLAFACACGCGAMVNCEKLARGPEFVFAGPSHERKFRHEIGDETNRRYLVRWYHANMSGGKGATRRDKLHNELCEFPAFAPQRWMKDGFLPRAEICSRDRLTLNPHDQRRATAVPCGAQ